MNGNSASHLTAHSMGGVTAKVMSPLDEALGTLSHSQGITESRLEELETRLGPALRGAVPSIGNEANAKREEGQSGLHEELLRMGDRQAAFNAHLQALLTRLVL
jgi:hypothetical protein